MNPTNDPSNRSKRDPRAGPDLFPRPACPRCGNAFFVDRVKSMRRYDASGREDWFRCDKCGHLYTRPRTD
jgi:predicted RNA-binding Zn-ribbon protein involved in translation (DUF1610 family)